MRRICGIFAVAFVAGRAQAQWVVSDPANLSQAIMNGQQMIQQLEKLRATYNQLQTTYQALSGSRGLASVLYNPVLRQYLPADWARVYDAAVRAGQYSGISGTLDQIAAAEKLKGTMDQQLAAIVARGQKTAATDKAVGLQAYAGAGARLSQTESLMAAANRTQDPKAIQEVQARIAVEQSVLQQETTKLQLVSMLQRAEERLAIEQKNEVARKILSSSNTGMPACCSSQVQSQ